MHYGRIMYGSLYIVYRSKHRLYIVVANATGVFVERAIEHWYITNITVRSI